MNDPLAIARKALDQWDSIIGEPLLVMHRENAVFKVNTNTGYAALRIHRPGYHARTEIESELQWMTHLVQAGLEVPQPFQTRQGQYVAEVFDGQGQIYLVDLLSWLDGEPLGISRIPLTYGKEKLERVFFDIGCGIARIHDASDRWRLPDGFQRHALDREGLVGETAAWGKFWEATCLTRSEKKLMANVRNAAATQLDDLAQSGAYFGLIHGDLVRENILVDNEKIRLIDFDDSCFGFRMFDMAVALVKNRDEPHYEYMKGNLFEGYRSIRTLSLHEEDSTGLLIALRDFAYLGWADARRDEPLVAPHILQIKCDALRAARQFMTA